MANSQKILQIICYFIKRDSKKLEAIHDNDNNKCPSIVIYRLLKNQRKNRVQEAQNLVSCFKRKLNKFLSVVESVLFCFVFCFADIFIIITVKAK